MAPKQRPGKGAAPAAPSSGGSSRKERRGKAEKAGGWSVPKLALAVMGPLVGLSMLAALAHQSRSSGSSSALAVTPLTEASFKAFVESRPEGVLVDFYTQQCPHCQKLAPDFEAAAKELQAKGGPALASLDGNAQPAIAQKYEINRYPTVWWFRNGENVLELPPQSRSKDKIVEFVEWAGQPVLVELDTREELVESLPQLREALSDKSPPIIVGYGGPDSLAFFLLEAAAERLRGKTVFLFVKEAPAAGEAVFRAFGTEEGADRAYEGALEKDVVLKWVQSLVQKPKKDA